jgi:integrase
MVYHVLRVVVAPTWHPRQKGWTPLRFTKHSVANLKPNPDGSRRDCFDDTKPGLGVRVSSTKAVYFVLYRAPGQHTRVRRRKQLGDIRVLDPEQAWRRARVLLGRVADREDPVLDERTERLRSTTVKDLAARWVDAHRKEWRPVTLTGWQRFLDKEILPAIGQHSPTTVTREDVLAIVDRIKHGALKGKNKRKAAPVSAARCYEVIRRMFRWAHSRGVVSVSPCIGIETPAKAKKGTRTYTNDELRTIFAALPGTQVEHLVPLVAYCATRSEETRSAKRTDIDLEREVWRIPPEKSKTGDRTGDAHDVPLSPGALRVLAAVREANLKARAAASPYLFPATADRKGGVLGRDEDARRAVRLNSYMGKPNRAMAKLAAATGIDGLGLHNIRRTVATRLSEHGTAVHVIEHILGHSLPALIRTYQLHVPLKEMREALDWWGDELALILTGTGQEARA